MGCGAMVCTPAEEMLEVWRWARAVDRWAELATVCLDSRS